MSFGFCPNKDLRAFTKLPEVNLPSAMFEPIRHYSTNTKSHCVINIATFVGPYRPYYYK